MTKQLAVILFSLCLNFGNAQEKPWIKAVFPLSSKYDDKFNVVTSDNLLVRCNLLGNEISSEPILANVGDITLENQNHRGFHSSDNNAALIFTNYEEPRPTFTPKSTGRFLRAQTNSLSLAFFGENNKLIIEDLNKKTTQSVDFPGKVVAADAAGNDATHIWVSYIIGSQTKTVLFPMASPSTQLTLSGNNQIVYSQIPYKQTSYEKKIGTSIMLVGKEGAYDSIRYIAPIYSFSQSSGTKLVPKDMPEIKSLKLPARGAYKVVSAAGYQAILKDSKNQFWLFSSNQDIQLLKVMGLASIVAASLSSVNDMALLAGSDNKIYWFDMEQKKITRITDLNKLKAKLSAPVGPTVVTHSVPISKGELKLDIKPSSSVKDYFAAIFSSESDQDACRYTSYGDIDGDGKQDFVVSYLINPYFDIFFGDAKGGFDRKARVRIASDKKGSLVKVADMNRDNYNDLVVLNPATGKLSTYLFTKDNTYQINELPQEGISYFEIYDYNFDYFKDIFVNATTNTLLINRGDAVFAPYEIERVPTEFGGMDDLDGDGIIDFLQLSGGTWGDTYGLYMGIDILYMLKPEKLTQKYPNRYLKSVHFDLESNAQSVKTGDFNGDGWIDFVVGYRKLDKITFFLNNKDGETFTQKHVPAIANAFFPMTVWDFDHDGRAEVAMMDHFKPKIYGLDQNDKATCEFCSSQNFEGGLMSDNPFWDLNDDGHMDFLTLTMSNSGKIHMNYTCDGDHCYALNTYLGSSSSGVFKFEDKGVLLPEVKTIVTRRPVSKDPGTYSSSSSVPADQRFCKTCKGQGFVENPKGACECSSSGLRGSSSQSTRCGWCSGSGSFTTNSTNSIGRTVSSSRSCPKCFGGMKSYGSAKYNCGICNNTGVRTYEGRYRCSECRGSGINIFDY